MQAGKLRHRATIQVPPTGKDALGQPNAADPDATWSTVADRYPGHMEELSGRELFNAQQIQPDISLRWSCRWLNGVTSTMRLIWHDGVNDRTLSIVGPPINPDGKKREMILMLKEAG